MSHENKSGKKDARNYIILLLLLLLIAVSVYFLFFNKGSGRVLSPDVAPPVEGNAVGTDEDPDDKLEQPEGGGAVSLQYSAKVQIVLSGKTARLMFANPSKSNQDMVVQILIQDTMVVQSGLIEPGNQVKELKLVEGTENQLRRGEYAGEFLVNYYDPLTHGKMVVETRIPIKIFVTE